MIRLRTLGTLDLSHSDGRELRAVLSQPRRTALLVYLAVASPRGFHRRDQLLSLFWPDDDLDRARASLNRAIYFLRRELDEKVIVSRGAEDVGLDFDRLWCDTAAFEDALDRTELPAALELYRGDLLPGFFASRSAGFERWLESTRSRLRERAAAASCVLAAESEARGDLALATRWARHGVELAPFDEVALRRLLTLLDRAGDRGGAAQSYQEFAKRFAAELDLAPSPETRALIEDIRSRELTNGFRHEATDLGDAAPSRNPIEHDAATTSAVVSPPTVAASQRRVWAAVGAATAIAAVALVLGLPALARARTDPRTVFVAPFANRTPDPSMDDLGRIAADRVTQSLAASGLVDALPPGSALALVGPSRAGTIVGGEFHVESDRIVFQVWITDVARNRVAWAVRPIAAPTDSAGRAIEEVSRRVTGAIAALRTPSLASWFPAATSSPPTFDAFQEFATAITLQSRGFDSAAVPHLRRAMAFDPTFTWARMQLALAHLNLFDQGGADSIINALSLDREQLNPLQRHWLEWMVSFQSEDPLAGYRAIRAAAEIAPERFRYNVAQWAMTLNRPREAIAELELLGPHSPHSGGAGAYWNLLTRCYHAVGDRERELRAARDARRSGMEPMSALWFEIRALAALGRTAEVQAMVDTAVATPREEGPTALQRMVGIARISSPAQLMVAAAQELRAHGDEAGAQKTLARALAWYRAQPAHTMKDAGRRFDIAHALYLSRDWAAADTAFRALAAADTSNFYIKLGFLGTIAARRNNVPLAREIIAKFDTLRPTLPQPNAVAGYWQSKISSILGDEQHALVMMADVWPHGAFGIHIDFDYERMWAAKDFRAFIRPRG
jgi:DNA-binding SARP family transcriptional activator